jgi:phage terminase small subunit
MKHIHDLNARQRAFIREYKKSGNATKAAIAAGYSAKTSAQMGSRLLKKAQIKAAMIEMSAKADSLAIASIAQRKEILSTLAREASLAGAGPSDAIRAIDTLNKMDGVYSATDAAVSVQFNIFTKSAG